MNGQITEVGGFGIALNHGVVNVPLTAGWNLISFPVIPDNEDITEVLKPVSSKVGVVWSYSAATKSWLFFKPSASGTLKTMQDGVGYWIFMTASTVLNVTGSVIPAAQLPPSYSLVAGWNLIGFKPQPTVGAEIVSQYLTTITGSFDTNNVWVYDDARGTWIRAQGSTQLQPGQAMWILMIAPVTLRP